MSTADTYVRARIDPGTKARAATREAIAELEAGKGQRFAGVEALMADLNADDWTIRPETPDDQGARAGDHRRGPLCLGSDGCRAAVRR